MYDASAKKWFIENQYRLNSKIASTIVRNVNTMPSVDCVRNCYCRAVDIVNKRYNTECLQDIPYGKGYLEAVSIAIGLVNMVNDLSAESAE